MTCRSLARLPLMLLDRHSDPDDGLAAPTPLEPGHARAARLEARLAVYAQYAAVVAEQAAAAAGGDAPRAEALAAERERVAEHFAELQAATAAGALIGAQSLGAASLGETLLYAASLGDSSGTSAGGPSFRTALDEALAELAHQGAVDVALAQRLVTLRDAVMRGAAWAAGEPASARLAAGPAPAAVPSVGPPSVRARSVGAPFARGSLDQASLENALVAARAAQVGGALAGQYPGRGTRDEWPAGWSAADAAAAAPVDASAVPGGTRLDVRF